MRRPDAFRFPLHLSKSFQRAWLDSELTSSTHLVSHSDVYGTSSCQCTCLVGSHTCPNSILMVSVARKAIELIILMAAKTVITAYILETVKCSISLPSSELALSRLPLGVCSSAEVEKYRGVVG